MNFSQALELLKSGQQISRYGWNGKGMYLFLVAGNGISYPAQEKHGDCADFIAIRATDGKVYPWLVSQQDLLATDWGMAEVD